MIWYKFCIGDYTADTTDLSAEEEGIYLRLMNWYYKNEQPLPDDRVCSISRSDNKKTHWVLSRFFKSETQRVDGEDLTVWRHPRIEAEIKDAQPRIKAARENGKKGGRPRKEKPNGFTEKTQEKPSRVPSGKPNGKANYSYNQRDISSPSSLRSSGSDTSGTDHVTTHEILDPSLPLPVFTSEDQTKKKKTKGKKKSPEAKSAKTWAAYSAAYELRYMRVPTVNAKVRRKCCDLVDLVGADTAPRLAAYYVTSNSAWHVKTGHSLDYLVKDYQKFLTEMETGRRTSEHQAREMDRRQGDGDEWRKIIEEKGQ